MTTTTLDTPAGVLLGHFPLLSPEWHAARANGIGGSEIAAVLGLSKWESRFSLWHRKAGRLPAQVENTEMEAGKRLEGAICQKFIDSHPDLAARVAGTYRNVDRPWQIANPDLLLAPTCVCDRVTLVPCDCATGLEPPTALLEAKFALYDDEWGAPGTDEIPPYYLAQCRHYLDVLGLDTCYVQVFIGSSAEFREYEVHPDPADTALLRHAGEEFMADLAAGRRPDIDQHSRTYQAIREMHPDIEAVDIELETDLARDYCRSRAALKEAEGEARRASSLVADALGTGRRATYLGKAVAGRQARGDGTPYLVANRSLPTFEEAAS